VLGDPLEKQSDDAERDVRMDPMGRPVIHRAQLQPALELAPGLDNYTMDSEPPVKPDAQGSYPVAMPGITKVL